MGQFEGSNDVNLQEDVAPPTQSSCKRRRSVKRSTNESSQDSIVTTPDDCLDYRYTCPDDVNITWLQAAPFLYDANSNDNKREEHTPKITGIFHEVLTRAIGNYMIIPVHNDEEKYGGSFPYVKILDSPGVVLIVPYSSTVKKWNLVFKAVFGTWPVVLMAFLMSSVAGVIIWALDSSHNPDEFPRRFNRGAFEGFWWAIVTITTIGYGDKTPKSVLARLFAVVWILIGVTVCSVMTATLTDALTSVKLEKYDVTTGKRIGVLKDSAAFRDAVNLAANITIFEDQDEMYDSLMNEEGIDVIMEDIFIGIEFMKTKDKSKEMSIAKFIGRNRGYGVAYRKGLFVEGISDCLSNVIKFRYDDVLNITRNYIKSNTAAEGRNALSDNERDPIKVFDPESPVFLACVIALSVFLIFCLVGCGMGVLLTKNLNRKQLYITAKIATAHENSTSKVMVYQELEMSKSTSSDKQEQAKI
ncbi:hypothetical protein ACROYT_G005593 [Oculina patagonica]